MNFNRVWQQRVSMFMFFIVKVWSCNKCKNSNGLFRQNHGTEYIECVIEFASVAITTRMDLEIFFFFFLSSKCCEFKFEVIELKDYGFGGHMMNFLGF